MKIPKWRQKNFIYQPHSRSHDPWKVKHHCSLENLNRHIILEICFDFLCKPASIFLRGYIFNEQKRLTYDINKIPLRRIFVFKLMKIPFNIMNGRNCGFPPRDTALYIVALLRQERL